MENENQQITININLQYPKTNSRKLRYRGSNLRNVIKHKIDGALRKDRKRGFEIDDDEYIDVDYITWLVNDCKKEDGGICGYCRQKMKFTNYDAHEPRQFTINRWDDNRPHYYDNVEICCFECNCQLGTPKRACIATNVETGEETRFASQQEASRWLDIPCCHINMVVNGRRKSMLTPDGRRFSFRNDH